MQIDVRMHDAARAQTRAAAIGRPSGCAYGAPCPVRLADRRHGAGAARSGARAVVALLLLFLMPLALVQQSSTGACRYDHRVALAGSASAVSGVGHFVTVSASVVHERTLVGDQHDHSGSDLPLDGAAPSACGPAALAERPAPTSTTMSQAALPDWRALSPRALATPPPAPPPRLS